MITTRQITLGAAFVLAGASAADAAVFPADTQYVPLRCGNAPMSDATADDPTALQERDLVGDAGAPTGLRASDTQNLYLRIRLDTDPAPAGTLQTSSWGMAFDLDDDPRNYELLILTDGTAGGGATIGVFTNHTTTTLNDPTDPADTPAAATYQFANNGRSLATGSAASGNPDFFLDVAVPWSALIPLGLDHDTPVRVWAASSSSANALNGDFACHDRRGGAVVLDGADSDPTTGDPADEGMNPPGGGTGLRLEGGGGCAAGGGTPGAACALLLLGAMQARGRTRARSRRTDRSDR